MKTIKYYCKLFAAGIAFWTLMMWLAADHTPCDKSNVSSYSAKEVCR